DVGHGGGSFDYTVAEPAIAQGCPPDTISSDIHVFSGNTPGMPYLPWVMSKFMGLGFTLEQVVAMATSNPAKVINRAAKLGSLQAYSCGRLPTRNVCLRSASRRNMPAITIERIEAIALRIPMDHWAPPPLFAGRPRTTIDTLLVRVTTNRDVVGWGEAYGGGWQ